MKRNDTKTQQTADREQITSALALRVLTVAEARIVSGALTGVEPNVWTIKPTAE